MRTIKSISVLKLSMTEDYIFRRKRLLKSYQRKEFDEGNRLFKEVVKGVRFVAQRVLEKESSELKNRKYWV